MTFEESMLKCNTAVQPSEQWKVVEKTYNDCFLNYKGDKTPKIPKILHQIWLGSPYPDKYKRLTDVWREKNPDWAFMLWTEKEVEEFGLVNKWMYEGMKNPSAKSDVIRYEVAYSYGGVYADTDFYCCRSLDDLLYLDFFCSIIGSYNGELVKSDVNIAPGIFGCSQGNKLVGNIIQYIGRQTIVPRNVAEIMTVTGPEMFSKEVSNQLDKHPMSVVFPPNYFYPFPGQQRESIRQMSFAEMENALSRYMYLETYAMHLWYCSWQQSHLL
jgi:inositol phosphorylceramide mannosyltransferase catalytic subunit